MGIAGLGPARTLLCDHRQVAGKRDSTCVPGSWVRCWVAVRRGGGRVGGGGAQARGAARATSLRALADWAAPSRYEVSAAGRAAGCSVAGVSSRRTKCLPPHCGQVRSRAGSMASGKQLPSASALRLTNRAEPEVSSAGSHAGRQEIGQPLLDTLVHGDDEFLAFACRFQNDSIPVWHPVFSSVVGHRRRCVMEAGW